MAGTLHLRSLREQVYDHLRTAIGRGELAAGGFLDLRRLGQELGISRTPLRDALLQLESDGFVEILPRRGVQVRALTLSDIRHLYEIIGALEAAAIAAVHPRIDGVAIEAMRALDVAMRDAVERGDFDTYYERNLAFHDTFLDRSDNDRLVREVRLHKQRLYDFPRRSRFVAEWESASVGEHETLVDLLESGDVRGAADHLRDVHWSFDVQERFIGRYYAGAPEDP